MPAAGNVKRVAVALRFADGQAGSGKWGHESVDSSDLSDRIAQNGTRRNANADTITYGKSSVNDIFMHLIIDDGVFWIAATSAGSSIRR